MDRYLKEPLILSLSLSLSHLSDLSSISSQLFFLPACCKIIQFRVRSQVGNATSQARTPTPTHSESGRKDYQDPRYISSSTVFAMPSNMRPSFPAGSNRRNTVHHREQPPSSRTASERSMSAMLGAPYGNRMAAGVSPSASQKSVHSIANGGYSRSSAALLDSDPPAVNSYSIDSISSTGTPLGHQGPSNQVSASTSHLPTPSSTPNTQRKNRRISNIFVSFLDLNFNLRVFINSEAERCS